MTPKTILLVDDDADLLQVVASRCQSIGFHVERARNLLTATTQLEKCVPDLVCVDVNMPTGNGLRFGEMLAADPRTAGVAIIVLTGHREPAILEACRRINAHYLFKQTDVWTTLEPLIRRLTATGPVTSETNSAAQPPPSGGSSPTSVEFANVQAAPPNRTTELIVVADDDADLVQMLTQRCAALGCSVHGVGNALDAINLISREVPDLVFLDVNMPSGSGLSVCEMMSEDERLRTIPVIVLTGQRDEQTIRRCHDMLVFYVEKGTNTWGRVEPLVRELLHLEESHPGTDHPPQGSAPVSAAVRDTPNDQDVLMEAVFAILGTDAAAASSDAAHESAVDPSSEPPWILTIDDDEDFSEVLKTRLEQHGVAVARASSGMEGYRMAFTSPASAILLDYNMPNGYGDYVLDRLKSNPVTEDIPVIVITGLKDKVVERRMKALGAAAFLLKPIEFDQLRAVLADYVDILATPAPPLTAAAP